MVGTDVLLRRWINLIRTQEVNVEAKRLAYNRLLGLVIDKGSCFKIVMLPVNRTANSK